MTVLRSWEEYYRYLVCFSLSLLFRLLCSAIAYSPCLFYTYRWSLYHQLAALITHPPYSTRLSHPPASLSMSRRQGNPSTWDQYERGGSPGRTGSLNSDDARHISFEENSYLGSSPQTDGEEGLNVRRRRYATKFGGKWLARPRVEESDRLTVAFCVN